MNLGKYTVSLMRIRDGLTVEFTETFTAHDDSKEDLSGWLSTTIFLWADGNYSCNCNRFLFFERALGKSEEEIQALQPEGEDCDKYEEYRVNFIKTESGDIVYEEDD